MWIGEFSERRLPVINSHNEYICSSGLRVSMPVAGIIRVTNGGHRGSYMVSAKLRRKPPQIQGHRLVWGNIALEPENNMALYYKGKLLCADYPAPRQPASYVSPEEREFQVDSNHLPKEAVSLSENWPVVVCKTLGPQDAIYGLGDKPGFLNKRHYAYENWCTDDPSPSTDQYRSLYKAINFFILRTPNGCCGFLADNTFRTRFDFGKENSGYFWFSHEDGNLDYYMIPGRDLKDVLRGCQKLTGRQPLQQKWVYGYHQSHWGYFTKEEVLEVVRKMRQNRLPMDAVCLDIDHMDGCRNFTFDPVRFGDPRVLTDTLSAQGVKAISIVDPGVKASSDNPLFVSGLAGDHFAKNPDGTTYIGRVWPGDAAFPDFTRSRTRQWWGGYVAEELRKGIRGIWIDMNEPANFTGPLPDNIRFSRGNHREIHNLYGHLMAQAAWEGMERADNRRSFVLTRACCAGSQRYCCGWTGDNHSTWAHMQMALTQILNLSLSGMTMVGADVGGYNADCTPELLIRWMQFGALCPYFRNHYAKGTRFQEPYAFGPEVMDICRKALDLRYHLLPYLYDLAHDALPMVRPLIMDYPDDGNCLNLSDQFLVGSQLLAAPVFIPGITARAVYLPRGIWYDYYTGKKYRGGKYILADAPLDRIPLFAKAGTILPVSEGSPQCVEEIRKLRLEVFPGTGSHIHYTDDGESRDYLTGSFHALQLRVRGRTLSRKVLHDGYQAPDFPEIIWKA